MRIIDLSSPVDAGAYEPDPIHHEVLTPRQGAEHMASEMLEHFGVKFDPDILPAGEFLSLDRLSLTSHTGTHVDAPSHYGSKASYTPARPRNIDEMPLDWFLAPGIVLDLTGHPTGTVSADVVANALESAGADLGPGTIVLLYTGAAQRSGTPTYFTEFVGLDRSAIALLLDAGVRVIGTDAFSLDAPFGHILARYRETNDPDVLWPAHIAGRDSEYCQVERLQNLELLPSTGFTVSCFPIKISGAGAGWARAVAILDSAGDLL